MSSENELKEGNIQQSEHVNYKELCTNIMCKYLKHYIEIIIRESRMC